MLFYMLFATSMAVSHRYRAFICSALILTIVASGCLVPSTSVPLNFFTRPIILEFALGMLCYLHFIRTATYRAQRCNVSSRIRWSLLGAAIIACMPLATGCAPMEYRVIIWGVPAAFSFSCILHGLAGVKLRTSLVLIGDASYSLYLFHPYIIHLLGKLFPSLYGHDAQAYLMAAIAMLASCILAIVSYLYLEKPVTELLRKRFIEPKQGMSTSRS
jgi:peptidoglycan/LPS O-acetylase OafA/YrhL